MVTLNKPAAGDTNWTTPVNDNWTTIEGAIDQAVCQGRLTLTTGTPVTKADVTAATTIYFAPYKGNRIGLHTGSTWNIYTFTERSLSLSGLAADTNFDVYLYDNAGTLTLEAVAWSTNTARATALSTQDGIYVKSGTTTKRYLGTFRCTGTIGQCEDSATKRLVYNYYNRVLRPLRRTDSTTSWVYTSVTWHQANAGTANKVEVVQGVEESVLRLTVAGTSLSGSDNIARAVSIGEDSTSAEVSEIIRTVQSGLRNGPQHCDGQLCKIVPLGYHYYAWLESSQAAGTTTWYGSSATLTSFSGLSGFFEA